MLRRMDSSSLVEDEKSVEEGRDKGADDYQNIDKEGARGISYDPSETEKRQEAMDIQRILRKTWIVKQVVAEELHEKACCMCHKNNGRNGEWYIENRGKPTGMDKVCLKCTDAWLWRQGQDDAGMLHATVGHPWLALLGRQCLRGKEGEGKLGAGQRKATQAGGAVQAAAVAAQANGAKGACTPALEPDAIRTPAQAERPSARNAVLTPVMGKGDANTERFRETGVLTPPRPAPPRQSPKDLQRAPKRRRPAGDYKAEIKQKVADIERRLPSGYVIRPVVMAHKRECSKCGKTSWELGDGYIVEERTSKPIAPYVYEKVCLACADDWLLCKEAEEEDY